MKLIVLDRDGVINYDSEGYIKSPDEWRPIAGSLNAISRLNQAGFHVTVATNQSGIGRGFFDMEALNAIHDKMHRALAQAGARASMRFFSVRTRPKTTATAASPGPACSKTLRIASIPI